MEEMEETVGEQYEEIVGEQNVPQYEETVDEEIVPQYEQNVPQYEQIGGEEYVPQYEETVGEEYVPQVADIVKPKHFQHFTSREEAWVFYNAYAKEGGFGTKKGSTKIRNKEVCWQQFYCSKEGHFNDTYQKRKMNGGSDCGVIERNRGLVRTDCKARMTVSHHKGATKWEVIQFSEGHNHPLATPSKVRFINSHRKVSKATRCLSDQLSEANVPTSQKVRILGIQSGGLHNMQCTERDIRNYERDQREEMKGLDVATLCEFFTWQKRKNPSFFFEFAKDDNNRMTHCFWSDPESRRAYESFGDVAVFDTTYNTNKYHMIFAPLVGVNQHSQTITFGFGFLSNEKIESFVWFFQQWMKTMVRGPPKMIITDQDPAMKQAIPIVFPNTFHRFCIWHIMDKFMDKLGPVNFESYYKLFANSVYGSDTITEFEESWLNALDKSGLHSHTWLCLIYQQRQQWVPAFVNHVFSAGMSSSQRAESSHSFFKKYVSDNHSFMDFITRFNLALEYQRDKELHVDWQNFNERPKLKSKYSMESQMSKVYTQKIFHTFQIESQESAAYVVNLKEESGDLCIYTVDRGKEVASRVREIVYYKESDFVVCSCRHFDSEGVPCRHMIAFFRINQVQHLPDKYILKRWTKQAKVDRIWDNEGVELTDVMDKELMLRHARLAQLCSSAVDEASLSEQGTELLKASIDDVVRRIRQLNLTEDNYAASWKLTPPENALILDPQQVRSKGCGTRMKAGKELATPRERNCRTCGKRGQKHDSRNCPLKNDDLFDEDGDDDDSLESNSD